MAYMKFRCVYRFHSDQDKVTIHIYTVDDFHGSHRLGELTVTPDEFNQLLHRFPGEFRELPAIAA